MNKPETMMIDDVKYVREDADKKRLYSQYMALQSRLAKANSRARKTRNELEKYMRSFPHHSLTDYVQRKIESGEI